jgi:hypothetical protein
MPQRDRPTVLIVDDHADDERARLRSWEQTLAVLVRHPQDVDESDLRQADLVVIDYVLDNWPERDSTATISMRPLNGLALAAVLRSQAEGLDGSPTGFVLRSAHLDQLSAGYPPESRLHVIARHHNLEWVLKKGDDFEQQARQIQCLSAAVTALPDAWPTDDPDATKQLVERWLAPPNERWKSLAWQDIEDCHPPLHELVERKHGLRFIRWFAQRILPYPCFLWTSGRLAARLRVTHESFLDGLTKGLNGLFAPAHYVGSMRGFLGDRWWRTGCEAILWDVTSGNSFDPENTVIALNDRCANSLQRSGSMQPVLCVDENLLTSTEVCEVSDAVRVQPDDWPAYAEQAWTPLERATRNPRLRASVVEIDRGRLGDQSAIGPESQ